MIYVEINRPEFEYDIHSLLKAFYPKEEVELTYTDPKALEGRNLAWTNHAAAAGEEARAGVQEDNAERCACIDAKEESLAEKNTKEAQRLHISITFQKNEIIIFLRESGRKERFTVEPADRKAAKNTLKQHLYHCLSEETGRVLPWGTLTGIRPTKIPMKMLEEGAGEEEIAAYMKETYFTTNAKIGLSIDIAKRERKLLSKLDYEHGYSLYIGIPFCPSTCLYCSFTSYPLSAWRTKVDAYLDALEKEIDDTAERMKEKVISCVYIGGGTPTTLEPAQLERLISKIKCSFDLSECLEFTVEAGRPDSITEEKLLVLRKQGISRISINPQTMKQATLDLIGRGHTIEQTVESFRLARRMGFDNINMDLIIGLPEETLEDVQNTMEQIRALAPDNVTVHSLAVKRAARLNIFRERYQDMQMVNTDRHMELAAEYCRGMELYPYYLYRQKGMAGNLENVGYAKEGKAGIYNILIMEEVQTIVALGAGAISKRVYPDGRIERCENVKDVALYIEKIDEMIGRKRRLLEGL